MNSLLEKARQFVSDRAKAYCLTFQTHQPANLYVLEDIARFCRANETCVVVGNDGHVDREKTLILEGRREVWLRIQQNIRLSPEELFALYNADYSKFNKQEK